MQEEHNIRMLVFIPFKTCSGLVWS